jgi:hypothetical protein
LLNFDQKRNCELTRKQRLIKIFNHYGVVQERETEMNLISQSFTRSLVAVAALTLAAAQVQAETYNFSQSFGAFGSVSGQFSGADANNDGLLDDTEVSFQSLNFSGGFGNLSYTGTEVNVVAFQWVTNDLGGLSNPDSGFDLYGYPDSGIGLAANWVAGEFVGIPLGEGQLYLYDAATLDPAASINAVGTANVSVAVTPPVPEPESYLMMAIGLAGIAAAKRRKLI